MHTDPSTPPQKSISTPLTGAGLGLRRCMLSTLKAHFPEGHCSQTDFFEVAPENWMHFGGRLGKAFKHLTETNTFACHGLSLSLGGPAPLDETFIKEIKLFLDEHNIHCYSEHLSYCSDDGHLYDLMPIPFTEEAVHYVSKRIKHVQSILERPIAIENISYYAAPGQTMTETAFINAVLKEANCQLLLDINNIYVNSINHQYNPIDYLKAMPQERIAYLHVAGHYNENVDLIIDTHGADVIDPVWALLQEAYQLYGPIPTLLERDFNIPPLQTLFQETDKIKFLQDIARQQQLLSSASHRATPSRQHYQPLEALTDA